MIFFTADTHYGHANIIKFTDRPFHTVDEMDKEFVERWNTVVGDGDTVYHLGDFALCNPKRAAQIAFHLNGGIHLIRGNHDKTTLKNHNVLKRFESVNHIVELKYDGEFVVLCHYSMRIWNKSHHGSWHLYGHSHGGLEDIPYGRSMDVGVDTNNYYPYSFDDIRVIMKKREFKELDHHKEK